MTNRKSKRALLMSILSMLLCCAMLIGTTFAWFTDTVTSGRNRIVAGNLDIDLLMKKADSEDYVSIANTTGDIFSEAGNGVNWEPGKTEIVYLAVKNLGSLASKYKVMLHITDDGLAEALEAVVLYGVKHGDLSDVVNWSALKDKMNDGVKGVDYDYQDFADKGDVITLAENGQLQDKDEIDYFVLAVHMKEDAGNEFMNQKAIIDVTVVAGQAMKESDSFGSDYDEFAEYAKYDAATLDDLKDALDEINEGNSVSQKVIVMGEDISIDGETSLEIKENRDVTIDVAGNDFEIKNADRNGILVGPGGNLTITDTTGSGKFTVGSNSVYADDDKGERKDDDALTGGIRVRGTPENRASLTITNVDLEMTHIRNSAPVILENADVELGKGTNITTASDYGFWVKENSTVNINGAQIEIGNGTYQSAFTVGTPAEEETHTDNCIVNFNSGIINAGHGLESFVFQLCTNGVVYMTGGQINLTSDTQHSNGLYYNQYLFISNHGGLAHVSGGVINAAPTHNNSGVGAVMVASLGADESDTIPATVYFEGNAVINLNGNGGHAYAAVAQHNSKVYFRENVQINRLNTSWNYYGMVGSGGKVIDETGKYQSYS